MTLNRPSASIPMTPIRYDLYRGRIEDKAVPYEVVPASGELIVFVHAIALILFAFGAPFAESFAHIIADLFKFLVREFCRIFVASGI